MYIFLNIIIIYLFIVVICYNYLICNHENYVKLINYANKNQKDILNRYSDYDNYRKFALFASIIPLYNIYLSIIIKIAVSAVKQIEKQNKN